MKLRYFMLPVIIISLMILIIDREITIENKTMFNDNIEINYPFFGVEEIDHFIEDYLNKSIEESKEMLIDYDYTEKENNYYVTFYKNIINNEYIYEGYSSKQVEYYKLFVEPANKETAEMKDLVKDLVPTYIIDRRN